MPMHQCSEGGLIAALFKAFEQIGIAAPIACVQGAEAIQRLQERLQGSRIHEQAP
jgi:hypothetical protein